MSIWDDRNLKYLLYLFDTLQIRSIDELSSIIFLTNYYALLHSGITFFTYRFVKSGTSIEALGLKDNLKEIITSNLALYLSEGFYKLTNSGKRILDDFNSIESLFEEITSRIASEDSKKKVREFIFIQKMKEKDEIIL